MLNLSDYQALDESETVNLQISEKTRALILSALFFIEERSLWADYDANSDEIDRIIAAAMYQVMR